MQKDKDILQLCNEGIFEGKRSHVQLIETSISWVLITDRYAYKIKKPVRLSFLNFSSLAARKKYCEEELRLNRRFSPEMYKAVLPVKKHNGKIFIGKGAGKIFQYAVKMKRMDPSCEMSTLLKKGRIKKSFIRALAKKVSGFHKKQKPLKIKYDPFLLSREFADIRGVMKKFSDIAGKKWQQRVEKCIQTSSEYVKEENVFIKQRVSQGYFRDGHGDLHTRNIFADKQPVLFDGIEFKKEFRQIDILNEIAFLCMDLETKDEKKFSKLFYKEYMNQMGWEKEEETERLFTYFKAFRACIRAKVNVIDALQHPENVKLRRESIRYIKAMEKYCKAL